MNAYCSTYDDDLTYYDFSEPFTGSDASASSALCAASSGGYDHQASSTDSADTLDLLESELGLGLDPEEDCDYDDFDSVERHAMRRATIDAAVEAVCDLVASGDDLDESRATDDAIAALIWGATYLPRATRHDLAESIRRSGLDDAAGDLALWRAGALSREALHGAARELLDAARVELALDRRDDVHVIEGPWRRGTPPLVRAHQLHVVLLAVRHAALDLDEVEDQVLELWQEELRTELSARQREIRSGADEASGEDHFQETVHLLAATAELWRDTAPAARPLRLPLEKLTRLVWQAAVRRRIGRAERAALLIASGNQRLDDLPANLLENRLYVTDDEENPAHALTATWVGGRRPNFAPRPEALNLATEALVIRALSGPARTGPRRG